MIDLCYPLKLTGKWHGHKQTKGLETIYTERGQREKLQGELSSSLQMWPFSLQDSLILRKILAYGEYSSFLSLYGIFVPQGPNLNDI